MMYQQKEKNGNLLINWVKLLFENFVYTFGREEYLQGFSGPIRARLAMAVARIIMQVSIMNSQEY